MAGSGESPAARRFAAAVLAAVCGVAATAAVLWVLSATVSFDAAPSPAAQELQQISADDVRPEPLERLLYLAGLVLLPAAIFGARLLAGRWLSGPGGGRRAIRLAALARRGAAPLLAALAAGCAAATVREARLVGLDPWTVAAWPACAAAAWALVGGGFPVVRRVPARAFRAAGAALVAAVLVVLGTSGFVDLGHVPDTAAYQYSFNAVFHSVVQVHLGKALLVDFANQYGLYPHLLEPLFALTGLSVPGFTAVMGALTAAGFWLLHRFLVAASGSRGAALLGLLAIVSVSFLAGRTEPYDAYFQIHPLRSFFPMASLGLAWAWSRRPRPALEVAGGALASVAVLWTPDWGLVTLGSWLALLLAEAAGRRDAAAAGARALRGAALLGAAVGGFSLATLLQHGRWPDLGQLAGHSRAYFGTGLHMLPMPPVGAWMAPALVYAAGLAFGIGALVERRRSPRALAALHLSVLGCGLFAYYQGRSLPETLWPASFPAIALCTMAAAAAARRLRAGDRALRVPLAVAAAVAGLAVAASFTGLPRLAATTVRRLAGAGPAAGSVAANAAFLRGHLRPGGEVLMLSFHSGIYHLATRTTCPLPVAGPSESIRVRDFDLMTEHIEGPARTVVADANYLSGEGLRGLAAGFPRRYVSPDGRVVVFER